MTRQLPMFAPGSANREEPIQARLLARADPPATSKQAARRVVESGRLTKQQEWALAILQRYGPGTCWTLAYRQPIEEPVGVHFMLARRLPELERKGLVRVQQDPSKPCRCRPKATRCRCRDVVRDGSRVWEICP